MRSRSALGFMLCPPVLSAPDEGAHERAKCASTRAPSQQAMAPLLPPREHRLLIVGYAGAAALDGDLPQLIEDGGRGRVDRRVELLDRHLDQGPIALRDAG